MNKTIVYVLAGVVILILTTPRNSNAVTEHIYRNAAD